MEFYPLYDKVILEKIEFENKIGEIFIPKNDNSLIKGKVIKIGNGILLNNGEIKPLIVKINDIVLFKDSYNVEKFKENNTEYYFIKESEIISIIK